MEETLLNTIIDPKNEKIRKDILFLIHNHLKSEGLLTSASVLKDECVSKGNDAEQLALSLLKLKKVIINGDNWDNCHMLISSILSSSLSLSNNTDTHPSRFSCHIYKYEYLQLINSTNIDDRQKAHQFLMQKLKPYEDIYETEPGLFKEFCYLLTCKSVDESNKFRKWRDNHNNRIELADKVCNAINDYFKGEVYIGIDNDTNNYDENNLMLLVQQAMAYQIAKTTPSSILNIVNDIQNATENPNSSDSSKIETTPSIDITEDDKSGNKKSLNVNITGIINNYKPTDIPYRCHAILSHHDSVYGYRKASSSYALRCVGMHNSHNSNSIKSEYSSLFIGGHDSGLLNIWESTGNKKDTFDDKLDDSIDSIPSDIPELLSPIATYRLRLNNSRARIRGEKYTCTQVIFGRSNNGIDDDFDDYDVTDDRMRSIVPPPKIRDICISPQGDQFATALSDGSILFLDINRSDSDNYNFDKRFCSSLSSIDAHDGDIFSIYYQPDGKQIISGGMDKAVSIYDLNSMSCIKSFKGHNGSICNVQSNNVGNLIISSSKDGAVKFWDVLSGLCVNTINPMTLRENDDKLKKVRSGSSSIGEVTSSVLSYDGRYLLVTSRFSAPRIVDIRNSKILARLKGYSNFDVDIGSYYRASFCSSDSKVATGGLNGTVNLWDVATGTLNSSLSIGSSSTEESKVGSGIQEHKSSSSSPLSKDNKYYNYSTFHKSTIFDTKVDQRFGMLTASSTAGISIWR